MYSPTIHDAARRPHRMPATAVPRRGRIRGRRRRRRSCTGIRIARAGACRSGGSSPVAGVGSGGRTFHTAWVRSRDGPFGCGVWCRAGTHDPRESVGTARRAESPRCRGPRPARPGGRRGSAWAHRWRGPGVGPRSRTARMRRAGALSGGSSPGQGSSADYAGCVLTVHICWAPAGFGPTGYGGAEKPSGGQGGSIQAASVNSTAAAVRIGVPVSARKNTGC